jgi:hypothetical protein
MIACCPVRMDACSATNLLDGSAVRMARRQTGKPAKPAKVKLQLTLDDDVAHRLKLAALGNRLDISEFVTAWVNREFSGVHIRGLDKSDPAGQGRAGDFEPSAPTVRIPNVTNRIGDIARKSAAPIDDAIDGLVSE